MHDGPVVVARPAEHAWMDALPFDRYSIHGATPRRPLGKEGEAWIVRGLIKAMPALKIEEYFKAKGTWFAEYDYLLIAVERTTDELIAVLSSRWLDLEDGLGVLHVTMQLITSQYQKTHLLKHMWGAHFRMVSQSRVGSPSVIAWRTCNPVAFKAMRTFTRIDGVRMYPDIDAETQDPWMTELARRIAARISPGLGLCARTGVIKGASVPVDFYPALPTAHGDALNRYFAEHLTLADRLLCVLSISTDAAKRKILKAFGLEP